MKVIHGLRYFKPLKKKPVVALGIFDGLHRGHQRIINNLLREAKRFKTKSLIITFFPHPQGEESLYSLSHRLELLKKMGVDLCLIIRFNQTLQKVPAAEFIRDVLVSKIRPITIFVGRNFTFGRNAEGNWRTLRDYSKKSYFKLRVVDVLTYRGIPVSSSYIRSLIRKGDFSRASRLLGRPVSIVGKVIKGNQFARALGYPTANIEPEQDIIPPFGVYKIKARVAGGCFPGICYIGDRPTIKNKKIAKAKPNIEIHIFDFKDNIYSHRIQIEFTRKLRDQKKFNSLTALFDQIKNDIHLCGQ